MAMVLRNESTTPLGACSQVDAAGAADLDETLITASTLTLLLPRDEHGLLGCDVLRIRNGGGPVTDLGAEEGGDNGFSGSMSVGSGSITAGQLLLAIYGYYQRELTSEEQLTAMRADLRIRRQIQSSFIAMSSVRISDLLGPRVSFGGLTRCSRAMDVYEVVLNK